MNSVANHKPHWTELPPTWRWLIGTAIQTGDLALRLGCIALVGASTWVMVDADANQRFTIRRGAAVATMGQGQTYASPIVGKPLDDLVAYQPSHGQSFGPETGNQRSYGPHGGVDFDARVGGSAGAAVASPISGRRLIRILCKRSRIPILEETASWYARRKNRTALTPCWTTCWPTARGQRTSWERLACSNN